MARGTRSARGVRVLVTAGPTREPLDDVRFLSNPSTGRMGHLLAREAARLGARVVLVRGPGTLPVPAGVRVVDVTTTRELLEAARAASEDADLVLFAAAPSDWRPRRRRKGKPPREGGAFTLDLVPTDDVAAALGRTKHGRVHVGFSLETKPGLARARAKMSKKRFDAIVWNTPASFDRGGGPVVWVPREGPPEPLPSRTKAATANAVFARALGLLKSRPRGGEGD